MLSFLRASFRLLFVLPCIATAGLGCGLAADSVADDSADFDVALSVSTLSVEERFEGTWKSGYGPSDVSLDHGVWHFNDAMIGATANDSKTGQRALRIRNTGSAQMAFDLPLGIKSVSLVHGTYGTDPSAQWELQVSTDAGASWSRVAQPVTTLSHSLVSAQFQVGISKPARIAIQKTGGGRLDIDDLVIATTSGTATSPPPIPSPPPSPPPRPGIKDEPHCYRVASWNIRDLSSGNRTDDEQSIIASIISEFDAITIYEINDADVLSDLTRRLNQAGASRWSSVTSDSKIGNSGSSAEYYGAIYNESVFDLVKTEQLPEVTTTGRVSFDREPFATYLTADDRTFDFAMMGVHITWGTSQDRRIAEVQALSQYYNMVFPKEHDVLVMGDFNRNADDARSVGWLQEQTGLSQTTDANVGTVLGSENTYDQILIHPRHSHEYTGKHGVVRFDSTHFGDDQARAKSAISDHRPVWVEVCSDRDDD